MIAVLNISDQFSHFSLTYSLRTPENQREFQSDIKWEHSLEID